MKVGIIGGSGYVGGEILRLLLLHPRAEITLITSRSQVNEYVFRTHPNLRNLTRLKFSPLNLSKIAQNCDLVFSAAPHGASIDFIPELLDLNLKIIDTSADFRLKNPSDYMKWYGWEHKYPELLKKSVYGLPEIYRSEIKDASLVACPGCMATSAILALAPVTKADIIEENKIILDSKIGSSAAGVKPTIATHHPERFSGVRPYKQINHRHIAEIEQELKLLTKKIMQISFSPYAVNMVRGILTSAHTFYKKPIEMKDLWKIYRSYYRNEPFIRLVRDMKGLYQLPNPSIIVGSNFCDIGFELDKRVRRLVILSALDNILKGAAGQAIQCFNIILGVDEKTGLKHSGFHPM
jgi:N-acetyl-gamma-glutamyl-phosphate/LysW-gamma-L-alpha-aminoadipyl-6-phosphate reductase